MLPQEKPVSLFKEESGTLIHSNISTSILNLSAQKRLNDLKNECKVVDDKIPGILMSTNVKSHLNVMETHAGSSVQEININNQEKSLNDEESDESDNTEMLNDWEELSKGRYFGVAEDEIICHKCGEPGHIACECFQEMCTNCGTVNDHLASRCPMLQKCHNCNELGHILIDCKKPRKSNICSKCRSKYHPDDMCPKIWRCYIFNPDAPRDFKPKRYCYNCAESGHYGDDCCLPQCSKYLEPSAFRVDNEPISASEYAYIKRQQKIKRKKAIEAYKEEEKEDWFLRKLRKKSSNRKFSGLNNFSKDKIYHRIRHSNSTYNESKEFLYNDTYEHKNNKYNRRCPKNLNKKDSIYINLISR